VILARSLGHPLILKKQLSFYIAERDRKRGKKKTRKKKRGRECIIVKLVNGNDNLCDD